MFGYVLWKSTNKTQVQGTRHCSIYFLTHPAGVSIGLGSYYDHRCLLYQLAQRWKHPVCVQPFTTTLISLGLIASVELLPFPSSDLGRNCCLSSLSELFFIVSSFNCKGHGRSKKPARFYRLAACPPMLRWICSSPSNAEDKRIRVHLCYSLPGATIIISIGGHATNFVQVLLHLLEPWRACYIAATNFFL